MCKADSNFELVANPKYKGEYTLVSRHTAQQKEKMVVDYLEKYDAYEYIELDNECAWS